MGIEHDAHFEWLALGLKADLLAVLLGLLISAEEAVAKRLGLGLWGGLWFGCQGFVEHLLGQHGRFQYSVFCVSL